MKLFRRKSVWLVVKQFDFLVVVVVFMCINSKV